MQRVLLRLAGDNARLRKLSLILPMLLTFGFVQAQTSGIFESFAIISANGAPSAYYDMQASTGNPDFNGASLGSFAFGSSSLVVKGCEIKTFKNGGCDITGGSFRFRVYKAGETPGAFTGMPLNWAADLTNGDQKWEVTSGMTNVLPGLTPGSYVLEVYSEAYYQGCGTGTHYSSNFGNNFKATFTVTSTNPVFVTSTSGTAVAGYGSLKAAFDAINAGTHQGAIGIEISGNTTETATASLSGSGTGSSSYTSVTIVPTGGAARIISGNLSGAELIALNGADNVTIDGLNADGNSLTFSNISTASNSGTSTIRFLNGASDNTITNCNILGSSTVAATTNGGTIFFSTGSTTVGNSNNTISNCNIGPTASGFPTKAIFGNGTTVASRWNTNVTLTNNNIFDYFSPTSTSTGIYVSGGCNSWNISNNKFFQTGTRTWTSSSVQHSAMWFSNNAAGAGIGNNTITGNTIGYASSTGTGTYALTGASGKFTAVYFNGPLAGAVSTFSNNTIAGISLTGVTSSGSGGAAPLIGLYIASGTMDASNNTIGSQTETGSLVFSTSGSTAEIYGLYNFGNDSWTTDGNNIGGISMTNSGSGSITFYGIRTNTSTGDSWTATSNLIGGTVPNSINISTTSSSSQVVGMASNNAASTLTSNVIRNLTTSSGTGTQTSASAIGILMTSTSNNHIVRQNTVSHLTNTHPTAGSVVTGIQFTGSSANLVERNFIHSLSSSTTSGQGEVNGIRVSGGNTTYSNNMIAIGASVPNAIGVFGINETSGANNYYHNSVYLGGNPSTGNANSIAFNSTATSGARNFRNNIFVNERSNNGSTGTNYIVRVGGFSPNPSGLTLNNNVYFGNGTGNVFGLFNNTDRADFTAWKEAVGQDAQSFNADPQFIDPTAATPNLHIDPAIPTPVESTGFDIASITEDFDGETRTVLSPVDIGADAGDFTSAGQMSYVSSTASQLTGSFCPSATNVQVLRIEVVTTDFASPLTLSNLTINANGTTDFSDIASYRIYYTGTNATFNTANPIMAEATGITAADVVITPSSTITLAEGTNYFWLVYNLNATISGTVVDGEFTNIALSAGGGQPTVSSPSGSVSVFPTPTALATGNATVCMGGTIQLNASTDIGTEFSWTGPASFSSNEQSPTIPNASAANAGVYSLTVTANGCSSVVSTVSVAVNTTPPTPVTDSYNLCAGGTIPSGEGLTSTAQGAAQIAGSQTINFDVASQPVETNSSPGNIVATAVMQPLPAGATVTGITINYNGIAVIGTSWRTDVRLGLGGAIISAAAAGTSAQNSPGILNYTRTATSGITVNPAGGNVSLLYWDSVSDNTGAEATFPTGSSVASVTINYTYGDPSSVQWYDAPTGGNLIGSGSPFNPIGNDPALPNSDVAGTYVYYAQVMNGPCASPRTAAELVIGLPLTATATADVDTAICAGATVTLSSSTTGGGGGITYSWKVGGTEVSTLATVSVTPATTTTYDLTVTDACSATATASVTIDVNPYAVITQQPIAPAAYCSGSGSATISVAATGATTYQWRRNGVAISDNATFNGTTTSTLTINNATEADGGSYDVTIGATGGCDITSDAVSFVVNPPAPTAIGTTICQGGTGTLTATGTCSGFVALGTTISGTFAPTPLAARPNTSSNSTTCGFSATVNRNYVATNFQVSVTGTYTLEMIANAAYDGMGYIVQGLSPGTCSGGGTFIIGDDDGGSNSEPRLSTTLTAGITYTLVSTNWGTSSGAATGSFTWTVTPPAGGQLLAPTTGTIEWYTAETGGTPIGSGDTFNPVGVAGSGISDTNTPGSTTFYAACSLNPDCRTAVTFNIIESQTYYADADSDGYGDIMAPISGCTGAPAGYVANNSDCDDSNASIHQSFTFYVDNDNDGYGAGPAVAVCAEDGNTPPAGYAVNDSDCDDTNNAVYPGATEIGYNLIDDDCDGMIDEGFPPKVTVPVDASCNVVLSSISQQIFANIVAGAQGYQWRVTTVSGPNAGQVQLLNTPLRVMKLTQLANYAYNSTYKIEVAVFYQGFLQPYTETDCTVTTPEPLAQLVNCGATLSAMNDVIFADIVPYATGYRFRITDPTNPANTQVLDRQLREFRMNLITDFLVQFNKTYNVEVSVRNTDGTYMSYGNICSVTTPVFPTTGLTDAYCDNGEGGAYTPGSMNTQIYASSYPGAIAYAFKLTGPGLPGGEAEVVNPLRSFKLNDFAGMGLIPGASYNVNVRLIFSMDDPAGPYGKTCTVQVPGGARIKEVDFNAVAYPNPFADGFNIDMTTSQTDKVSVKVYDMAGRLLQERTATVSDTEAAKLGERFPAGVYNVIVTQGEEVKTLRVIKR